MTTLNIVMSRAWCHRVTWRHRLRDVINDVTNRRAV